MRKAIAGLVLAVVMATTAMAQQWYEGGTLHRATVTEWNAASQRNKLATMADYAATTRGAQRAARENNFELVRLYAESLVICIDTAVEDPDFWHFEVAELGAACITLLGMNK